ncbi:GPI-anchored micronemal antigen [Plasmodium cynomolgi strain B]|uniref:GPI-anchored micronemal antigen n=1 Tax=Plasmodium cynomolgi (strain B) TaxID=1120755 RepID=K6V7L6_PLACD|nr:GPI-anchored micronemal antigen [Plasmodium cynomolgi strain B]GAB65107.1 GPI-anchored micronemal antigen [Plasmodium cynomolgi strain B]
MKCNAALLVLLSALLSASNALIRNGNNTQALVPEKSGDPSGGQNNPSGDNQDTCEIQKMAEEMMEKMMKEKDMFSSIMEPLQSKLPDDHLCSKLKYTNICLQEKDKTPLTLPCTSPQYEQLIQHFTYKKLCNSQVAFSNVLLKSFINKKNEENTFNTIIQNYKLLSTCIDEDLKDIYNASIDLFSDIRTSVTEITEKLWSKNMIEVLKAREQTIAGILCELRNGNNSTLVSNSLSYENFGILKVNYEELLNQAYAAFSDYYSYFPAFAIKLLEKGGLVERTRNILKKINEKSKNEVLNNGDIMHSLSSYKHHAGGTRGSFLQSRVAREVRQGDVSVDEKGDQTATTGGNQSANMAAAAPKDASPTTAASNAAASPDTTAANTAAANTAAANTAAAPNTASASNAAATPNPAAAPNTAATPNSATPNAAATSPLSTPLYDTSSLKTKDVVVLVRDLLKNTNIIKFEKDEPTSQIDEEGIKKLIESSFFDLSDNTMLMRLLIKPQAAILFIIQSFIMMTPSPTRDAKIYCKKVLVNGQLVETSDLSAATEEEDLINEFSSKYNLFYERLKLEELREIEQNRKALKNSKGSLSVLEVGNSQNGPDGSGNNGSGNAANGNNANGNNANGNNANGNAANGNNGNGSPLIAVVGADLGEKTDDIIKNNVDVAALAADVEQAFRNLELKSGSFSANLSHALVLLSSIALLLFIF